MGWRGRAWASSWVAVALLVAFARPAEAFELSGGVSLGGILVGTEPRFAVSPHIATSWHMRSGFLAAVDELCSILPGTNNLGVGVYNHISGSIGYVSEDREYSVGPSISFYSMPACGLTLCGRVAGVAPGAHVQTSIYFAGPLGVSVSANVDWVGGKSLVLPGGIAAMVVVGPVFRWRSK